MPQQKLTGKQNTIQAIKFLLFSLSAAVIQWGSFELISMFTKDYSLCYLPPLVLSVLWNFTLNREFTFKSAANVPVAMLKVAGYYAVFSPLSDWWGNALTNWPPLMTLIQDIDWRHRAILLFTMIINLVTEFTFDRFVVYRKKNQHQRPRAKGSRAVWAGGGRKTNRGHGLIALS